MNSKRIPIIAGNWKMCTGLSEALTLAKAVKDAASKYSDRQVMIAPPYVWLAKIAEILKGSSLALGAQNLHFEASGAFTGEISIPMLKDAGCSHVLIGHSERRQYFCETDELVNKKLKAALKGGLTPIVCVGESLAQREAGKVEVVVGGQIRGGLAGLSAEDAEKVVIAYEPVWAIGTGKTATSKQAQEVHAFIRKELNGLFGAGIGGGMRIQYGGSVKPDNIDELMNMEDIDGALVGGASLKADGFARIIGFKR